MFDPQAFPYVRVQSYTDGNAPAVLSDEFYNPVQDALARQFGGLAGISTSISDDEFCNDGSVVALAPTRFGKDFLATTLSNVNIGPSTAAGNSVCGAWNATVIANGPFDFVASDASVSPGSRSWILTARVRIRARARIETVANEGFTLGWSSVANGLPAFAAGNDQPNWQAVTAAGLVDTGVAVVDDTWTWLIIACASDLRFYISTTSTIGAPAVSAGFFGNITSGARFLRCRGGAGLANDYFEIDKYARGMER